MSTETKPKGVADQKTKTVKPEDQKTKEKEIGGFENMPEPTRFGDWDVNGRCSDF